MTGKWIAPDQLFDGQDVVSGLGVRIEDGHIAEVAPAPDSARALAGCLTPGFIDLQVNGGGGVQLNSSPTAEAMSQIAAAHRRFGTVAIMPTVITDAPEILDQVAEAAIEAKGAKGVMGLHIEGPHISEPRRGTHDGRFVRPMDDRTMDVVQRLRQARIAVMITLAPEAATQDQISKLAAMGAVVSLGHTDATAEAVEEAIAAGATCATHLFNAMSPMTSRAPGAVGAILNDVIHAGIICDGHHVDMRMIELALKITQGTDRLFLVSDAMATVGGPDTFDLYGQTVRLDGGRLINAAGNLAGAHVTQAEGVKRVVEAGGADLARALRMAVTTPATLMGQSYRADLVGLPLADAIVLDGQHIVTNTLEAALHNAATVDAAE